MKENQSLHLTVKQPPNPEPVKTLGIFSDPDNPDLKKIIDHYLSSLDFVPKSSEFDSNVKDEVIKLLTTHKPVAVARKDKLTIVYFQE